MSRQEQQLLLALGLGGIALWLWFTRSGQSAAETAGAFFSSEPQPPGPLPIGPQQSTYDLIAGFEGFESQAYQDVAGVWTIGYGHTGGVQPGQMVTPDEARALLQQDITKAVRAVSTIQVPLTQNQYDALVSLAYNIGNTAFLASTLVSLLNSGDYAGAAAQFQRWNRAGGNIVAGLAARRSAEQQVFTT